MIWQPLIPPLLLVLLAVAALAVLALRLHLHMNAGAGRPALRVLLLRLLALGLVLVVLAGPARLPQEAAPAPQGIALVLDRSASMAVRDAGSSSQARVELGRETLAGVEEVLRSTAAGGRFAVSWWQLDAVLTPGTNTAPGTSTAPGPGGSGPSGSDAPGGLTSFAPLAQLAGLPAPPVAVVLASDGIDRGAPAPDDALAAARIGVHTFVVGSTAPASNLALRLEAAAPSVFPGQEIGVTCVIDASGDCRGEVSELRVVQIEGDGTQRELLRRSVVAVPGLRVTTRVAAPPALAGSGSAAATRIELHATLASLPGEATTADNESACVIAIADRRVHVVIAEGTPWWDTSFAVRALRGDRQLSVDATWRVGSRTVRRVDTASATGPTPVRAPAPARAPGASSAFFDAARLSATSAAIDVLVLGLDGEALFDADGLAAIERFVREGGGLLLLGGGARASTLLAGLDPLTWTGDAARPERTLRAAKLAPGGARLALLPAEFSGEAAALPAALRPGAELLIGEATRPLVAWHRYGLGRVADVGGDGLWRWGLDRQLSDPNPSRASSAPPAQVAERFWRQLIKALAREAGSGLQPDRDRYRVGQTALLSVGPASAFASAPASASAAAANARVLHVHAPDGSRSELPVSEGLARLPLTAPGLWRVASADAERAQASLGLAVDADVREVVDIARREDRLVALAGSTLGDHAEGSRAAGRALGERLLRRADLILDRRQSVPVLPFWLAALVLALVLTLEWTLRRRIYGSV